MTITVQYYDTNTLLGVMSDPNYEAPSTYWLSLCFGTTVNFDDEFVDFEKLVGNRKLAPFVAPMSQGRPIYELGSEVTRFKPAYIKPKDPVSPARVIRRQPGELLPSALPNDPMRRRNVLIADILRTHRSAIERRWEWMAAQAVIGGKVTIEGDDYPTRVVDFKRAAGHTITLGAGARWGDAGVSILGNITTWRSLVFNARYGGPTNRLTVGVDAWEVMRKDDEIKAQLDTQMRGTQAVLNTGIRSGENVEYVGNLSQNLQLWVYNDFYEASDGTSTPFMSSKDVVLTGPNVNGVRAFGAILDVGAQYRPLPIYPKNWAENDPPVEFVMSQSAPLMVPVNPNNTLKATVLG